MCAWGWGPRENGNTDKEEHSRRGKQTAKGVGRHAQRGNRPVGALAPAAAAFHQNVCPTAPGPTGARERSADGVLCGCASARAYMRAYMRAYVHLYISHACARAQAHKHAQTRTNSHIHVRTHAVTHAHILDESRKLGEGL